MADDQERQIEIAVNAQLGIQNAIQPTNLPVGAYLVKLNAYANKIGSNTKRPGSYPVTSSALASTIPYLTEYRFPNSVTKPAAPTLSSVAGGSTLPTATYYVRATYVTDHGETEASNESSQAIVLGAKLRIVIAAIPYHANSINLYISTSSNTETLRYNVTATTTDVIAPLPTAGVVYPIVNTTAFLGELLASSGTTLYSYYNNALNAATMTNTLASSNIYTTGFTNTALTSILFIADGGALKKYNGSAVVNITPAADDPGPAPANGMAAVNLLLPIYAWVHTGHLFVSDGKDVVYYTKQYEFDYIPVTNYERWVRNNDYITGCGVSYGDVMLLPMRRGWGVLTGSTSPLGTNPFNGNLFLNTISGNIAPRGIEKLTYPDGSQTVAFWSDDGAYEIYDTGYTDSTGAGSRNFATRSLMKDKLDFSSYGFTETEKTNAESYFDSILNLFITTIKRGVINYAFIYDVRTREWDLWDNIIAESTIRFNDTLYYAGSTKFLHAYDTEVETDYSDYARTTGTIVSWDCYTDVIMIENSGFQSIFDYLIVNAKNFPTSSSIEITVVGTSSTTVLENAVIATYATWDVSLWDFCVIVNEDFTSLVGAPSRTILKKRGYFFQIRYRNIKDEKVELYKYKLQGRSSGN